MTFSENKLISTEVLLMLYQLEFLLTPRQAQQLIWSRTVNYVGLPGQNVPCDMHLEQTVQRNDKRSRC